MILLCLVLFQCSLLLGHNFLLLLHFPFPIYRVLYRDLVTFSAYNFYYLYMHILVHSGAKDSEASPIVLVLVVPKCTILCFIFQW